MSFFSFLSEMKKKRFTAFTFIQVFYLLGSHFVQVCHLLYSPSLDSRQVSDNRFTVSTSAEMKVNRTRLWFGCYQSWKKKGCRRRTNGKKSRVPRSKSLASVKVDNQWRVFPQFHSAACFSQLDVRGTSRWPWLTKGDLHWTGCGSFQSSRTVNAIGSELLAERPLVTRSSRSNAKTTSQCVETAGENICCLRLLPNYNQSCRSTCSW